MMHESLEEMHNLFLIIKMTVPLPCETVTDVAGEIAEVGSAVSEFKVGDKVVAALKFWVTSNRQIFIVHSV
jgi:NADPH:quinone reductase-like Zn-dependent oxidoreductase